MRTNRQNEIRTIKTETVDNVHIGIFYNKVFNNFVVTIFNRDTLKIQTELFNDIIPANLAFDTAKIKAK